MYYRLGDYIPLASSVKGLPTENGFAGQGWWPSGISPGSPAISGVLAFIGGVDPYTGDKLHEVTDESMDRALNLAKFTYDIFSPPSIRSGNWDKTLKAIDGTKNFAGRKVDVSKLIMGKILGLKIDGYNMDQETLSKRFQDGQITRDYQAVIAKYKREEMRSGNPDYESMDADLLDLETRMREELDELYKVED